ncbi:cupin domain-containing protein [Novosphingobium sp. 1949]|uniref:Cupin domain-containing protein n=1 Tax=Novosphingobium organovorum TaxID=2930092 RepID=A0ABT0BD41_9SPHN|nr:cupin domain-containing protein [Novosphingobium organovorum]MCJ2182942.1 cupin domain-containing protein [Novosphingobium organovorum]
MSEVVNEVVREVPGASPVGAVLDMRAYARGARPSTSWFDGRAVPAFADDKAVVSALAPRGEGRVERLASDECVLLLGGRLEIASAAGVLVLEAGSACVLPLGTGFTWRASEAALAIVYAAPTETVGTREIPVLIDQTAELEPSSAPLVENLVGPVPSCRNHSDYWSANREFVAGVWDSTPYHRIQIPYRQVELMYLLDGAVTFADAAGQITFCAGDVCLFVRGEGCAWISERYVRKIYATQRAVA